jgi:hypothetical protein
MASGASAASTVSEAEAATAEVAPLAVPGFDTLEHRFGVSLGAARVAQLGIGVAAWRLDYTLAWRGWGIGVGGSFSLAADRLAVVGIDLRRGMLLGPGRLCGAVELGIARLQQGFQGERTAVLYHGTSSALELAYEFGRERSVRPFVALRADLPWYTTESETLTPALSVDGARELTLIGYRRDWTPLFGAWVGVAL